MDYFGARYYSGPHGRFTSTDPVLVTPARMLDPQRFNLYSYARNNPFAFVDPTGRDISFVNDTEEGRKKALALITKNMTAKEAANIDIRKNKKGAHEAYVKDPKAIAEKGASVGYRRVTDLIGDHSVNANVGLIGNGLTATFKDLGKVSSFSMQDAVIGPAPGDRDVSVIVSQGDVVGTELWSPKDGTVYQGITPDYVAMYHELVGETMKYRAGNQHLLRNPALDSNVVVGIDNEIRWFHKLDPRTLQGHGFTTITVEGKIQ